MRDVPIERHQLKNGLRVVLSRNTSVPVVAVNVGYDVGSRHEEPGRTGLAHLFEHLMFQGSVNVAKGEHGRLINAAGGRWNAGTMVDHTNYYDVLPSHGLELALWLEAERLANLLPAITQENLDNQREVVRNERRLHHDNPPYGSMEERLHQLMYPAGHPYQHHVIGSMDDLGAASLDDVKRFFSSHYAPNNAVLVIAGDFETGAALDMIGKHFGPIGPNAEIPAAPDTSVPETLGENLREVVADDVEAPRVCLAFRIPPWGTPEFDAFDVISDVLGTGRASRLYRRLIRERELAQDVAAVVFPFAFGAAVFVIWATARPDVSVEDIERALIEEVGQLADAGLTDEELGRARVLHRTSRTADVEEATERAERLGIYTALWDEPERINDEVPSYDAIDALAVREALWRFAGADNRLALTFVPKGSA